jgi:hypothetical protein
MYIKRVHKVGRIIEYLGRYTHKVAITTHRIKEITDTDITFRYKLCRQKQSQRDDAKSYRVCKKI